MSDVSYSLARGDADGAVEVGEQLDRLVRGVEGGDLEWMAPEGGKDSSRAAADQQLYFDFRRLSDLTSALSFAVTRLRDRPSQEEARKVIRALTDLHIAVDTALKEALTPPPPDTEAASNQANRWAWPVRQGAGAPPPDR